MTTSIKDLIKNILLKAIKYLIFDIDKYKYLWLVLFVYCSVIIMANWFDVRLIKILSVTTTAGTLIYPITFSIITLIVHHYGRIHSKQAILLGFIFNLCFILYGQFVVHLPAPDYNNEITDSFNHIFTLSIGVTIGSISAYFTSEYITSFIYSRFVNINTHKDDFNFLPYIASTSIGCLIDTFIFVFVAFYLLGELSLINSMKLFVSIAVLKIIIDVILFSIFKPLSKTLSKLENKK